METPTKPTTTSQEECTIKITRCQIKFPFGFMTDDDCDTCIGKDEIYAVGKITLFTSATNSNLFFVKS